MGLSPRVRGNRDDFCHYVSCGGSIPACAGEPKGACTGRRNPSVYPRVCGGTTSCTFLMFARMGLSPRVRGNQSFVQQCAALAGSIPACAGEPTSDTWISSCSGVYPRVCGGTSFIAHALRFLMGLSPRVRGNHEDSVHRFWHERSIPACAGEPRAYIRMIATRRVYPRVCGGT